MKKCGVFHFDPNKVSKNTRIQADRKTYIKIDTQIEIKTNIHQVRHKDRRQTDIPKTHPNTFRHPDKHSDI